MRERYRILRTLAVPLAILVVFLVVIPKTCLPKPGKQTTRALTLSAPAESDVKVELPAGFDETRIEYLIEVDRHFSEPKLVRCPRRADAVLFDKVQESLRFALLQRGYIEATPAGDLVMTRDGLMAMGDILNRESWDFPIARRKFLRINSIADAGAGQHDVSFNWKWELTGMGLDIGTRTSEHGATARFVGQQRSLVLSEFRSSIEVWP